MLHSESCGNISNNQCGQDDVAKTQRLGTAYEVLRDRASVYSAASRLTKARGSLHVSHLSLVPVPQTHLSLRLRAFAHAILCAMCTSLSLYTYLTADPP